MVRTTDNKNICGCGGTYLDSHKTKHARTKKHQSWLNSKLSTTTQSTTSEVINNQPQPETLVGTNYWSFNEPTNQDEVDQLIKQTRSKYKTLEPSKRYINTTFYNNITSYNDILSLLKETYTNSKTAYRINFSLGVITETHLYDNETIYDVLTPGEIYYFTHDVADEERDKKKAYMPYVINKKSLQQNVLNKVSEDNVISWLENLLKWSKDKVIGVFSMAIKTIKMDLPIGCTSIVLPDYIMNSHYMNSLNDISNNLCFFACIALAEGCRRDRFMNKTKEIFQKFYGGLKTIENYEGIQCFYQQGNKWIQDDSEISKYEQIDTRYAINIYNVFEDHSCTEIRRSVFNPQDPADPQPDERKPIYLNLYLNHFSYITDPNQILGFRCSMCYRVCRDKHNLTEHRRICSTTQQITFPEFPMVYTKPRNMIIELCEYYGVKVNDLFIYDYMIGFDFEAIKSIYHHSKNPNNVLEYISQDIPLSFSVMSNLDNKIHFEWSKDPRELVTKLFQYFDDIQQQCY
jgi:hypothetical protein